MTPFACGHVILTSIGTQLCSLMLVLSRHCSGGMCNIYAGEDIASEDLHQHPYIPSF